MPPIAKAILSLALAWAAVEIIGRWWHEIEWRHYPHRDRISAEKFAAFITVWFAAGVLIVSAWSQ